MVPWLVHCKQWPSECSSCSHSVSDGCQPWGFTIVSDVRRVESLVKMIIDQSTQQIMQWFYVTMGRTRNQSHVKYQYAIYPCLHISYYGPLCMIEILIQLMSRIHLGVRTQLYFYVAHPQFPLLKLWTDHGADLIHALMSLPGSKRRSQLNIGHWHGPTVRGAFQNSYVIVFLER